MPKEILTRLHGYTYIIKYEQTKINPNNRRLSDRGNENPCCSLEAKFERHNGRAVSGVFEARGKTEKIIRMEEARKRRQPQPSLNPAFLSGGSMAKKQFT